MKASIVRALVFVLFVSIAVGAYFLALGITDSIYQFRSPLHDTPPEPGAALGEPMARVVFVLIDALRYDTSLKKDVMPTLNGLREMGAYARMTSQPPSYSAPGYSVLLTGAWPYLSDGPAFNLSYDDIPAFTQDNLFAVAKRSGLNTAVSGYYWFEKLLPANVVDEGFFTPDEDHAADRDVVDAALPWLQSGEFELVLIHLDQVDYAGHHEGGPRDLRWDAAAARSDALLAEILAELDLTQDVIFVCADHGQIDAGGHGGQDPITLVEPFVMAGKGVSPGDYGDVLMVDVAPTLAAILGANLPASTQGSVLTDMLSGLPQSVQDALPFAAASQQQLLAQTVEVAFGLSPTFSLTEGQEAVVTTQEYLNDLWAHRLQRERLWRLLPGLVIVGLLAFVLWKWRTPQDGWLWAGLMVYAAAFQFLYVVIRGKVYSYSVVTTELDLIVVNGVIAVLLSLLVWFFLARGLHWFTGTKNLLLSRSVRFFLFLIGGLTIPLLVHFVWNGLFVTWTLPALGLHYLTLLSLIQIMFLAGSGLLIYAGILIFKRKPKEGLS